jgi:APA family basic amino acid/polyamine antiporter
METKHELRRQLGLASATALIVGEVIGLGIFLTPSKMTGALGSPFWTLAAWLVMGAMTLCGGLCYGELAARFPEAGGGYVYLREAFGRPVAFLYGWVSMVVIDPGITAALAVAVATYAAAIVPISEIGQQVVAVGTVLALAAVNCLGVRLGAGVLRALTLAKLGLLAFIVIWSFGHGLGDFDHFRPLAGPVPGVPAQAAGLMSAFFCFGGWWDVSKVAGEVRDPERTMPRALALGIVIVTAVFIVFSAASLYLLPADQVKDAATFAALAGVALFGPSGGAVFSGMVILIVLGSLSSILMCQPRLYFAMARDGLFLPALAQVHPRLGTPLRAIALEAILASLLVLWGGNFDSILGLFLFMAILLIALSVAALFVLRRGPKPFLALPRSGYPLTAAFYLLMSAVLLVLIGIQNRVGAAVGVSAAGVGLLAYLLLPAPGKTGR